MNCVQYCPDEKDHENHENSKLPPPSENQGFKLSKLKSLRA